MELNQNLIYFKNLFCYTAILAQKCAKNFAWFFRLKKNPDCKQPRTFALRWICVSHQKKLPHKWKLLIIYLFCYTAILQRKSMGFALYRIFWSEVCEMHSAATKNSKLAKTAILMQKCTSLVYMVVTPLVLLF